MTNAEQRVGFEEFGTCLLAGLRLRQQRELQDDDLPLLHAAFLKAYESLREDLGEANLRFEIALSEDQQVSPAVYVIMNRWNMTGKAARDRRDPVWRLYLDEATATQLLNEAALGGPHPWLKAADAFVCHLELSTS